MTKITRRKDGRYQAAIMHQGKRTYFYGHTEKDVREQLKAARLRLHQGLHATDSKQPLRTLLEDWYAAHAPTIKASAARSYRSVLDVHLLPDMGHISLKDVNAQRIQRYYGQLDLAPRSIRLIHAVLNLALDTAVEWGLIAFNPCSRVKLPRIEKAAYAVLDEAQAKQLLTVAREHWLGNLITLALATGMRKGELQVLKWTDIDWRKGELHVQRTLQKLGKRGGGMKEGTPKSETSDRIITLPAFALDALKAQRKQVAEMRLQAGAMWRDEGYVFPSTRGHWLTNEMDMALRELLTQADLPLMRFHDLRHSAASLLLAMGVPLNVVQQILGHSKASTTSDIYGHVLPGQQAEAMKKYDEQLG